MKNPKAMFILGGPGSGKDYLINNILKRYDLVEVQMDQVINGGIKSLIEQKTNLLINGNADIDKIQLVKIILEGYQFSHTIVSVTNKVSRERNATRDRPLSESVRIRKWLDVENSTLMTLKNTFIFKNSLNLSEASKHELDQFKDHIAEYLKFLEVNEVLEWGTQETTDTYKAGTPGQSIVDVKPKLTLKALRRVKRGVKGMPPAAYDSRVGGVDYSATGSYGTGASYAGGLVSHHVPKGDMIKEVSSYNIKKYLAKAREDKDSRRADAMDRSPNAYDYIGDNPEDAEDYRKDNNRDAGIDRARRLLRKKK